VIVPDSPLDPADIEVGVDGEGGEEERMKRDACRERRRRLRVWMIVGRGRRRRGSGGRPMEREAREMKTKVWSI
jgi:hypothetical protein